MKTKQYESPLDLPDVEYEKYFAKYTEISELVRQSPRTEKVKGKEDTSVRIFKKYGWEIQQSIGEMGNHYYHVFNHDGRGHLSTANCLHAIEYIAMKTYKAKA